jgi:hypothetical protein
MIQAHWFKCTDEKLLGDYLKVLQLCFVTLRGARRTHLFYLLSKWVAESLRKIGVLMTLTEEASLLNKILKLC